MKVVLIDQNYNEEVLQDISLKAATPLGLCYLASYVQKYVDASIEVRLRDGMKKHLDEPADLVGISSMSNFISRAVELAGNIKREQDIPVILGGPHISILPHTLAREIDVAVLGEGEETFAELITAFRRSGRFLPADLERIKGIAFWSPGGELIITPERPPLPNLDDIPIPRRDLWPVEDKIKYVASSRGCPFKCAFCATAGRKPRHFSTSRVVEEIALVHERYGASHIAFIDDLFLTAKARMVEIIEGLRSRGLLRKIAFAASIRADLIDEDLVALLKKLNVQSVYIGLESGSDRILHYLKSETVTVSQNQRALDLLAGSGIIVEGSFIIGSPREEEEDLRLTHDFILNNYKAGKLIFTSLKILTPYPGTKVWSYALERGLVSEHMDWTKLRGLLETFDPYNCIYLGEIIPLVEFVDYVDVFEELSRKIRNFRYFSSGSSDPGPASLLDRERLKRFKKEMSRGSHKK